MTKQQAYRVATIIATNGLQAALFRLAEQPPDVIAFAKRIGPMFKKVDGFVPKSVNDIINQEFCNES